MFWLLRVLAGLIFPACAQLGTAGLPPARPIDFAALVRPTSPNTALAAPAGFTPAPDIVTRPYPVSPDRLYAAVRATALAQPRTFAHGEEPGREAHFVARSAVWNFPDLVTVQVRDDSTLIIWSRSVYGYSDLGANRRRVDAWLAALDARLASDAG